MKSGYKNILIILFFCGVLTSCISFYQEGQETKKLDVNPKTSAITITSPQGGDVWYKGNTYDITWTSSYVDDAVVIDLYHGGTTAAYWVDFIVQYTDDDGTYSWTIPTTIIHQADYIIGISDYDGYATSDFSEEFTITEDPDDDDNGDDTCLDTYSWCFEGGEELIWEVTLVDATGLESLYGTNWNNVNDDRYTVGAERKRVVDRITAFPDYCNWRVYCDTWKWTTSAFSSTPDNDNHVDTIYMDPAYESWLTRHELFPMDVVDYFASSSAGSSETISNNKVTYEASEYDSRPGTNVNVKWVYTYDANSGVLSKFQEYDASNNIVWQYELTSEVPDCSNTNGDDGTNGGGGATIVGYDTSLIFGLFIVFTLGIACVIWRKSRR